MLKRIIDLVLSLLGLGLLSPILLLTAIFIKLESKGRVFFIQTRVGKNRKEFKLYKFRTMHSNAGLLITSGKDDKRITRIGRIIRKLHLDEVVQLINVLKGDMSIVGPRPEVAKYVKFYPKKWDVVLSIKPGITGKAVIEYARKEYEILAKSKSPEKTYIQTILPKKLELEIDYVKNQSLWLDLKIIFQTIVNSIFLKY
jgi:lipopolysaccharide/colanic/teichoic acid biosynthesis glycosyltransferase